MRQFVILILLLLVQVRSAQAYLDPGSGSMVLQVIIGGIAGILLAIKLFWGRILGLFGIRQPKEDDAAQNQEPQ